MKLSPIKQAPKPFPFAVCDIEARQRIKFLLIGYYDGKEYRHFTSLQTFLNFVYDSGIENVFAHYGGMYDFKFLIEAILASKRFDVSTIIPRGSGMLSMEMVGPDLIGETKDKKPKFRKVVFRDTSALFQHSLKSLCENFEVETPKQDWDHSKTRCVTKALIEYNRVDCVALYEIVEKFYSWPLVRKAGPAVTMASQAMRVLRLFLKRDYYSLSKKADEFVRRGYIGGRTEIIKPLYEGTKEAPLDEYDVNSLYPWVMQKTEVPGDFLYWTRSFEPHSFGFYEAIVWVPPTLYVPPLGIKRDGKLIFPTGRVAGVFSTLELRYAQTLGCEILETGKGAIFENAGLVFKEFVDTLWDLRSQAQQKGKKTDAQITKSLMNNCYGRYALRLDREIFTFDDGDIGQMPWQSEITVKGKKMRAATEPVTIRSFTNVAVAAWITSAARIEMHKLYRELDYDVYYTDTDSIFTPRKMKTGKNLGEMKHVCSLEKACFLLPKVYAKGVEEKITEIVAKGFERKKINQEWTYEDVRNALDGDLKKLTSTISPRVASFKEGLNRGFILGILEGSTKSIKSSYDKRIVFRDENGRFDTRPLFLEETNGADAGRCDNRTEPIPQGSRETGACFPRAQRGRGASGRRSNSRGKGELHA